jgi:hypothetical protein
MDGGASCPVWGDPVPVTTRERLVSKVVAGPNGCWIWTGYRNPAGYGQIGVDYKVKLAHRVSYELFVGPITKRTLDHLCNTPACINPTHLHPATDRENILRGTSPSAAHARQTHCKYGHEFTPENTYWYLGKWRNCRECMRRKASENYARSHPNKRPEASQRTHCPHGHPYDEANTYWTKHGHRQCRTCARLAERRRKQARS